MFERHQKNIETVMTDSSVSKFLRDARDFVRNKQYDQALREMRLIRKLFGDFPTLTAYEKGCKALKDGKYEQAKDIFLEAFQKEQNPTIARYIRATAISAYIRMIE